MGCDIHIVLERKLPDGKWIGIDTFKGHESRMAKGYASPIARARNYDRFAALAGVRGDGPEPRGAPEDASDVTKLLLDEWGCDAHSSSWLPIAEASQIWLKTDAYETNEMAKQWPEYYYFGIENMDAESADNHRVVFWFDN